MNRDHNVNKREMCVCNNRILMQRSMIFKVNYARAFINHMDNYYTKNKVNTKLMKNKIINITV